MSTASPLPLSSPPAVQISEREAFERRQEIAARLQQHRQQRSHSAQQARLPTMGREPTRRAARGSHVAESVAARFAKSQSYREFLAEEAASAVRQAEAAAEVARRNAEAVSVAQQHLLEEIEHWNRDERSQGSKNSVLVEAASPQAMQREPERVESTSIPAAVVNVEATVAVAVESQPEPAIEPWRAALAGAPQEPAVPIPANLLEFPRQLVAARKARPRLAEGPLRDETDRSPERAQLRIFEVDARSLSTEATVEGALPEWVSIRLENSRAAQTQASEAGSPFAPAIQAASMSRRCMAAVVDGCCIVAACFVAVIATVYAIPELPSGLPAAVGVAGLLLAMVLVYQTVFFTFSDATPGMRFARIGLCTFEDENPTRRAMRRRIFALVLSAVPAGLGVLWAFLDDEGLGWHDRISRMYQRAY